MPPLETPIVKRTLAKLRSRGGFWIKVHGSPMQQAGIPDIVGCYKKRFTSFEVKKNSTLKATPLQAFTMEEIRTKGGGISVLISTPEEALRVLDRIDELEARTRRS
jgi:Holliday junction resolvase